MLGRWRGEHGGPSLHGALAKPTRTLALPCHPQDSFSRLQTTKYQYFHARPPFEFSQSPRADLRLFFLTPARVLESLAPRFLVSGTAGHTEPEEAYTPIWVEVVAVGNSRAADEVVPATATDAAVGIIYDILAPLIHIPAHIIDS